MATIKNAGDVLLQATTTRLLLNPINYLTVIASSNTVTRNSGVDLPSSVTIKVKHNGALKGTPIWSVSPSVTYSNITDGITILSSNLSTGTPITVTASLTYLGNTYSDSTVITKKEPVSLGSSGTLTGENGGSITTLPYGNVSGGPPSNATANIFTTSTSDPTGGSNGDAHYNSSTNVMWFKVSGTWQKGGTINASQITTGTLAAAQIAANSITSDKINVTSLSAINANLGTITAGSITGNGSIDITGGSAKFNGPTGADFYTGYFNDLKTRDGGIKAFAKGTAGTGVGVYGDGGTAGDRGVAGVGRGTSVRGVQATNTAGGWALDISQGYMTINSTSLVSNLNADMVDSLHASSFVRTDTNSNITGNLNITGTVDVTGTLRGDTLRIDQTPATGSGTANYINNNKPGGSGNNSWIQINCNGTNYYVPVWL